MKNPGRPFTWGMAALLSSCFLANMGAQTTGPTVQLSPGSLSFASQVVGTTSAPRTETVTVQNNNYAAGVTFSGVSLSGNHAADFAVQSDTCSGTNIFSGSCQISIVFHPSATGMRSAAVSIQDSVSGSPQTFTLQGTAIALKLTSLVIGPPNPSVVSGSQIQLSALGIYNDGTAKDVTSTAAWDSSDKKVATVRQGLVTGVQAGRVIITATLGGVAGQTLLGVQYQVSFVAQPGTTLVSKAISPGVKVLVRDNGSPVAFSLVSIDLGPSPPNPAELSGSRTRITGEDGTVTFDDLKLDYFGDGYRLVASTPGLLAPKSTATSNPFNETRVGDPCLAPEATDGSCPDTDNDGLNDAWEKAGGIDFNGDGVVSASERVLTNFDPRLADGTVNPHPSAEVGRKDVFLRYDYMQVSDAGHACTSLADAGGHCSGSGAACTTSANCDSPQTCLVDQYCVGHCSVTTARTCNSSVDCGGRCSVTTANFCQVDADCPTAETCLYQGEQCVGLTSRGHSDAPTPAALMQVIQAFSDHDINLHISPEHRVVPHETVVSFGPPIEGCAAPAGHLNDFGRAIDFYKVKPAEASSSGPQQPFIHYALFGHLPTCDSPDDCRACPVNPETGLGPTFRSNGLAEIVGNDLIVAYGAHFDAVHGRTAPTDLQMAGTFMHELGHNLGLNHGGAVSLGIPDSGLNFKPNYLSVMNYSFQSTGIGTASPNCAPGDMLCKITPIATRVDYANTNLAPLDETRLNETVGINSGTNDITVFYCPGTTLAPGMGPIDWDCNGDGGTELISGASQGLQWVDINNNITADVMNAYADWPNLNFKFEQNSYTFPDAAGTSRIASPELDLGTSLDKHILYPHKVAAILVRPGCSVQTKPIAPGEPGVVPVALLGSDDLDVSEVEPRSLKFHGAEPLSTSIRDVNLDGKPDLVAVFDMSKMKLHAGAVQGTLTGWLHSSQAFLGSDSITVLPSMAFVDQSCR